MKNNKSRYVLYSMLVLYLAFIVFFIIMIIMMPRWMNERQVHYGDEVQTKIYDTFQESTTKDLPANLSSLRKEYPFEIAVYIGDKEVYQTLPGMSFSQLRDTLSDDVVIVETQGEIVTPVTTYKVWYSVYHLRPQQYFDTIFTVQMVSMVISFILLIIIAFMLQRRLMDPLAAVKKSLKNLENYQFDDLEISDDVIGESMQHFATNLQQNIKAVSREHTELERALQLERERLQNMITVSRGIVHDLKTPVHQTLLENEYTLSRTDDISDETKVALEYNIERMDLLMREINDVLHLMDTGVDEMMQEINHFDVVQLFKDVKKVFEIEISQKELSFLTSMDENLVVELNKVSVHLILHNLLSNATKYASIGSDIEFELFSENNQLHLVCKNTASENDIERMLSSDDLFQTIRVHNDNQFVESEDYVYSTGNGLYLLKELSNLLGGSYELLIDNGDAIITIKLPLL